MTGSIRQRPDRGGAWEIHVDLGRGTDGRRRQRSRLVRGSRADAEQVLAGLQPREPRFPTGPLEDLVDADRLRAAVGRLGVKRQWYRWRLAGLPERRADELAVEVGLHPAEVWADWIA